MFSPGPTELFIILAIVVIIFGAGKAPKVAKEIAQGLREFKIAVKEPGDDDVND